MEQDAPGVCSCSLDVDLDTSRSTRGVVELRSQGVHPAGGVGIGVDYALYVMNVILTKLRSGKSLPEAYDRALRFAGRLSC